MKGIAKMRGHFLSQQNRKVYRQHMTRRAAFETMSASFRSAPEQISDVRQDNPDSIALIFGAQQLTYEEVDRRADQFSSYLMNLGIARGDAVAICMERSFEWIIAALGSMRAGAAYMPLDCAWPDSRLRFAVNDSGATVVVARAALLDRLQVEAHEIDPYRDAGAIAAAP